MKFIVDENLNYWNLYDAYKIFIKKDYSNVNYYSLRMRTKYMDYEDSVIIHKLYLTEKESYDFLKKFMDEISTNIYGFEE